MKSIVSTGSASNSILPDYRVSEFKASSRGMRCCINLGDDVAVDLLQTVYAWSKGNLSALSHFRMHKARDICGLDNWQSLLRKQTLRNYAGMCLAFLSDTKSLPLRMHLTKSGKGSKHYWIQSAAHNAGVPSIPAKKPLVVSAKDIVVT